MSSEMDWSNKNLHSYSEILTNDFNFCFKSTSRWNLEMSREQFLGGWFVGVVCVGLCGYVQHTAAVWTVGVLQPLYQKRAPQTGRADDGWV